MSDTVNEIRQSVTTSHLPRSSFVQSRVTTPQADVSPGHLLTFLSVCLFTILLFYRPFEFSPQLSGLSSVVLPLALFTFLLFIVGQLMSSGKFLDLTTETKCAFVLTIIGIITIPIASNKQFAIESLRDGLGKISLIFLILTIVVSTLNRYRIMLFILIGACMLIVFQIFDLYNKGVFKTESYRVSTSFGMIGNPNEASLFILLFMPLAITSSLFSKSVIFKICGFLTGLAMVVCVMLTQSRGGFLGLVVITAILTWKLGRNARLKTAVFTLIVALGVIAFAPGNYSNRILAIFDSSRDEAGSSNERTELLKRSILVTLRNPQGVGLGNSKIFGARNLETHNAFTQVSSELGIIGLIFYVIFLIYPLRELYRLEQNTTEDPDSRWFYYQSIGLQAGLGGFLVTSFFASVAYQWYIYYLIALAIAVRKIYASRGSLPTPSLSNSQ